MLLKSVHLTPTYACRHLGSWIILAANQEVMGCAFLWKHSLSVCCWSVSVDSLSLRVPFVLLVFICPSKDFHVTVYDINRRKIYWLNPKAQNQVPNTWFFLCSFAINLLCVICPHQERSRWRIGRNVWIWGFDLGPPVSCNVSN